MPKCKIDPALRDQVHRFICDSGLTINGAAVSLDINRTTFWRFCETGKASARTKLRLRDALDKRNKAAANTDSDVSKLTPTHQVPALLRLMADRELKQIRRVCEGVLALIDVYEAQRAQQKS